MSTLAYGLAVLALLLAPGPTNTLIGLAGARHGLARVIGLVPAELAGYLAAILPAALVGAQVLSAFPALSVALKLAAALWVMILAVKLWRSSASAAAAGQTLTAGRIFVTTALNPKALVIALVLLPAVQDPAFLPRLGLFCLLVAGVALLWGAAGALTRRASAGAQWMHRLQRIASGWLGLISLSLLFGALQT
ncbi:LysE family translocator [Pseudotabrizicola algicola]|uniref:LysE family translocator n=1 Tax=Pseudotabrizicola algicola TaxID=2709381 RepID=A0A6B3RI65_9RHOB|nr:hypothetical protein [Pseudotabrizicola algicola]NEX45744.1 hypothetical protein [Pseudotabrizicola algicola]